MRAGPGETDELGRERRRSLRSTPKQILRSCAAFHGELRNGESFEHAGGATRWGGTHYRSFESRDREFFSIATARSSSTTATSARSTAWNSSTVQPMRSHGSIRHASPLRWYRTNRGWLGGSTGSTTWHACNDHIAAQLAEDGAHVDLFAYCPYHPDGVVEAFARASDDRKPSPGMAKAAAQALNLDLSASWVVGDRPEDMFLAQAVGASAVYLGEEGWTPPGVERFRDLAAATSFILERIAA